MDIEEIKDFVYEVRTFGITSNDTKFVQITEYLLSELEKEKEKNKPQPDCAEPVERAEEMVNMRWVNHRFISKDKLKEILGIEEETDNEKILSLLQTLVDENNRLEDIEDRKVQIEYNNVFNKGVKSVEDKIKATIEEINKEMLNEENSLELFYRRKYCKEILQSLLEKE